MVPGLDGRKMSKSYDNTIEIFDDPKTILKKCKKIVTDSTPVEDPKDPDRDNLFQLFKLFAPADEVDDRRRPIPRRRDRLRRGQGPARRAHRRPLRRTSRAPGRTGREPLEGAGSPPIRRREGEAGRADRPGPRPGRLRGVLKDGEIFMKSARILALLALLARPASAADTVVYSNDFEAKPGTTYPEWTSSKLSYKSRFKPPGSGTREAPPVAVAEWPKGKRRRFLGEFGGPKLDPTARTRVGQTVSLRLEKLAPHSTVTVSFDLLVLRSWDGDSPAYGPDRFRLAVAGGPTLLDATFSNNPKVDFDGSLQGYPKPDSRPRSGASSTRTLDDGFFGDSIYRLGFTFDHSADALTLEFASDLFEGKGTEDEAWGLDNVIVSTARRAAAPKASEPTPRKTSDGSTASDTPVFRLSGPPRSRMLIPGPG